jgi:hypothetical protein
MSPTEKSPNLKIPNLCKQPTGEIYEDSDDEEYTKKFRDYLAIDKAKGTNYFKRTVKTFQTKIDLLTEQNSFYSCEVERLKRNMNDMRKKYFKELSSIHQTVFFLNLL